MSAIDLQEPPRRLGIGPMVVGLGLFMQGLDGSAIATALPTMARSLEEDPVSLNLAISSYLLASAVFIPATGWLADRFGGRRVFCAAMALFTIASLLCGLSQTLWQLIGARVLQGAAGAMMVPVGRLIVIRSVPRADLVRAWSFLTIPGVMGPVLGPALGGFIATAADWRWIFFINLPIGGLALLAALKFVPDIRVERPGPLDIPGFLLVGTSVASLVFALHEAAHPTASPLLGLGLAAAGVAGLALYPLRARRAASPILDLTLLRIRTFRLAVFSGGAYRIALGVTPILVPMLLQVGFGLDALQSGLISFTGAVGALSMKGVASRLLRRFGFRGVLTVNAVLGGLMIASLSLFTAATPHLVMMAVLLLSGSMRSLQFTSLSTLSYSDVPHAQMSRASAFGSMAQELFGAVGAALAAVLLQTFVVLLHRPVLDAEAIRASLLAAGVLALCAAPLIARLKPGEGAAALPSPRR